MMRCCLSQIVRIKSFSASTAGDVKGAIERLKSKGISRLVVDLRGNVGGLLPAGIDTASYFLDSGKVQLQTRLDASNRTLRCSVGSVSRERGTFVADFET